MEGEGWAKPSPHPFFLGAVQGWSWCFQLAELVGHGMMSEVYQREWGIDVDLGAGEKLENIRSKMLWCNMVCGASCSNIEQGITL